MKIEFTTEIREEWMYYALLYGKDTADEIMAEKREISMTQSTTTDKTMVPVLYCDIDGTVRHGKDELGHFVNTAEDVRVFDDVADLLWGYKKLGWRIVGVSNQGGIALGYMDMATCLKAMAETQKQTRFAFDKLTWCSHHPDAEDPEMAVCWCRKPKAGMVIESALILSEKHPGEIYPPHLGLFVGDRPEDEECAKNAGLQFLDAGSWRAGQHLALIKDGKSLPKPREISATMADEAMPGRDALVDMVSRVNPGAERLSDDILNWALEVTGVKAKKIPASELEMNQDFVYDGLMYTVVEKYTGMIKGKPNNGDISYAVFFNPWVVHKGSFALSWDTMVTVEDKDA